MAEGYAGKIVRIDLSSGRVAVEQPPESFYRSYLGGGGFGAYFLLKETDAETDPLGPENLVIIAPGLTAGPALSGVSRCSVTALSPETGLIGDTQAGGSFGPYLKRSGFDAVLITGRAESPVSIFIEEGRAEIRSAASCRGMTILDAREQLASEFGSKKISVIQCGPAGEHLVRYAGLACDLNNYFGRTGMGAVFGSKNLRAVIVSGSGELQFHDREALRALARKAASRVQGSGFVSILSQYGTPGLVEGNALQGNLCTRNYSAGYHPDYMKLDGRTFEDTIASKPTTCYGCVVGCRKTIRIDGPIPVTDRLGGPEFETIGVLGFNLGITDPAVVGKANEICNNYGLDTITFGGIVAALFEAIDRGLLEAGDLGLESAGFGSGEALLSLAEATVRHEGIGKVLAGGFEAVIAHFGEKIRDCAVQVKNHGFAVHLPQVKPAMALIYAVAPIGADHMSCEHDWLNGDTGEASAGLGLYDGSGAGSTGPDKVRMVLYSQYYYGLLDSLGLCMFCWGAGSLYLYQELEELIRAVTGTALTFWELMKAGERRVNMMRLLNIRRGAGANDDELPKKMFEPLPDGPSRGRRVDPEDFQRMRSQYYRFAGWTEEGNPCPEKLEELGLEWTL